ncbi:MAG: hypothetical protein KIT72_07700 [Polyangiaceae bacterium]|nr:hypothetical protein [Polyangiaceae bacterium]
MSPSTSPRPTPALRPSLRRAALLSPLLVSVPVITGCPSDPKPGPSASTSASAVKAAPSGSVGVAPPSLGGAFEIAPGVFAVPSGPSLLLEPLKGAGPIRFGANLETIERLMGSTCNVKRDDYCSMPSFALEFKLTDGLLTEIRAHRVQRLAADGVSYGVLNGALAPDLKLGTFRGIVLETLGAPRRVDPVTQANSFGTFEVAHYEGLSLEFDQLPNSNNVLGGVVLRSTVELPPPPQAAPSASAP